MKISIEWFYVFILCAVTYGILFDFERNIVFVAITILILMVLCTKRVTYLIGGIILISAAWHASVYDESSHYHSLQEGNQTISGYVDSDPQYDEFNTKITIRVGDTLERVRITVPHQPRYFYGDVLKLSGNITYPEGFVTDTGRYFAYDNFLRQENIFYVSKYPHITKQERRDGSEVLYRLFVLKHLLLNRLYKTLPEPHGSLMAGLILGVKSSLGPELLRAFTVTGVVHIIVLSGFNVTIIADFITRIFRRFGSGISTVLSIGSIVAFAAMTGATPPVVRASIMAVIVIIARISGYQTLAIRGLLFVACCMVLHNPLILVYNPSFQLSFLASLGLIVLAPWMERKLAFIPETSFQLRGLAAASLSTQVFVFPLLVYMTGEVSLISPLANIVVLWVVPIAMFVGGLILISGFAPTLIQSVIILVGWTLLSYILTVVQFLSGVPYASPIVPTISLFTVLCLYGIYFAIYKLRNTDMQKAGPSAPLL